MFTREELKAIQRRTPAERDAIDAWWATQSEEQKRAYLDQRAEDVRQRELLRDVVGGLTLILLVVLPGVLTFVELARRFWN